jgi:hypothetical protein
MHTHPKHCGTIVRRVRYALAEGARCSAVLRGTAHERKPALSDAFVIRARRSVEATRERCSAPRHGLLPVCSVE